MQLDLGSGARERSGLKIPMGVTCIEMIIKTQVWLKYPRHKEHWFSNVVPGPGTYGTTWELGRNANSWAHPGPSESETLRMGSHNVINSPLVILMQAKI